MLVGTALMILWTDEPFWSRLYLAAFMGVLVQLAAMFGYAGATAISGSLMGRSVSDSEGWEPDRIPPTILLVAATWVWWHFDKEVEQIEIVECVEAYSHELDPNRPELLTRWCAEEYPAQAGGDR